jgi:hypothetical protein
MNTATLACPRQNTRQINRQMMLHLRPALHTVSASQGGRASVTRVLKKI